MTNFMKKYRNYFIPIFLVLFLLVFISLPFVMHYTYADRANKINHTLTYNKNSLVWNKQTGIDGNGVAQLDLFNSKYQNVKSNDGKNIIAPGTNGNGIVRLKNNISGDIEYTAVLYQTTTDKRLPVEVNLSSKNSKKATGYVLPPGIHKNQVVKAIKGTIRGKQIQDLDIDWVWNHDEGNKQNKIDTNLGNKQKLDRMKVGLWITVEDHNGKLDWDIDINGDGNPDLNIDTDHDHIPDLNIDIDGDHEADINIDTSGDGKPNLNIDTDGDHQPDLNIDTNSDGQPDLNIDTNGDGRPDLNIDGNGDGRVDPIPIPEGTTQSSNVSEPDQDENEKLEVNVDSNDDGNIDLNIDIDGDGKPDINIDSDKDGKPDQFNANIKNGILKIPFARFTRMVDDVMKSDADQLTLYLSRIEGNIRGVDLSKKDLRRLVRNDLGLKMEFKNFIMDISNEALDAIVNQAKGDAITFSMQKISIEDLTNQQRKALADLNIEEVFEARIYSDGKDITDFLNGEVTMHLLYVLEKDSDQYKFFAIGSDGTIKELDPKYVDGHLTFTTDNFTDYVLSKNTSKVITPESSCNCVLCWLGIFTGICSACWVCWLLTILLIISIILVICWIIRRAKKSEAKE